MNLLHQLHELRGRVRRLLWLTGLSWVVVWLLSSLLVFSVIDWRWHLDDRWLRAGFLGAIVTAIGVVAWRRLFAPLRWPLSNFELSSHLERYFPTFRGRLATAVEFLEHGISPHIGSPELQQRLIEQTAADVAQVEFTAALDRRESTRAMLTAAGVCAVVLVLAAANSAIASTALARLLWPFGDRAWPKAVELQLVTGELKPLDVVPARPLRSVQGQPLDVFAVNARGPLPQPVLVEFRRRGSPTQIEPLRTTTLRNAADQPREAAAIRLPIEQGSIEFRVTGGDDHDMPWRTLELVPPVKVESFQLTLIPPKYTGEPSTLAVENATQVRAVLGSRLQITARASRPIQSATWHDPSQKSPIVGRSVVLGKRTNDPAKRIEKQTYEFELLVKQAGSAAHRLSLVDRDGFENSSAWRLDVVGVPDPPPNVTLVTPATDQLVTSNALIPVVATANDDRELKEVALEHRVVRQTADAAQSPMPTEELSSIESPDADTSHAERGTRWLQRQLLEPMTDRSAASKPRKDFLVQIEWKLEELSLSAGDRLLVRVVGSDRCDVGPPRVGRSVVRTLTIVTPEEKQAEIANRLDLLRHDLETLAAKQSLAKDQAVELRVQLEKAGEFRTQDRDSLKRVELDQRQIDSRLTGRGDGVTARARGLLEELQANRLTDDVTKRRLTDIAVAIEGLGTQTLPPLESMLGRLVKSVQLSGTALAAGVSPGDKDSTLPVASAIPLTSENLADIAGKQAEILTTLQLLVRDLTQWRDRRELAREVAELANVQETLNRETSELAPSTLGKSVSQLSNQQQADVAKLADRQARQAERIEQLRQRVAGDSTVGTESQPTAEVVRELDERSLIAKAREAAQEVAANNLGQAGQTQQKLAADLKALAEKLEQTPNTNAGDAVRELKELESQLDALRDRQQKLLDETHKIMTDKSLTPEQSAEQTRSLPERQAAIKTDAEELASQLKSMWPNRSANRTRVAEQLDYEKPLRRASQHMAQAEQQLGEQQLDRSAEEQQAALDDLEQSRRELADARRDAQQQQLSEKANELTDAVKQLIAHQQAVIGETERLAAEQQQTGKWTRPLSKAALNLGEAEQGLSDSTRELAESLSEIEAIKLTLDRAAHDLSAAAQRLRDKQLGDETRDREQVALRTLQSLADALAAKPPTPDEPPPDQPPASDQPPNSDEQPTDPVPPVAQLKLLRQLQNEVRENTKAVETRNPKLETRNPKEIEKLADDQQAVSGATSRLLDRFPAPMPDESAQTRDADESKPREGTLQAMRQAHEALTENETGEKTQIAQQTAVEQIDALLKLWQQRAGRQQAARTGQRPSPSDKPSDENSKTTSEGTGGKPTGRNNKQARNSSDRENTGPEREAETLRQRQLRAAVWGHLPPALREKMLNLPHDKTLPKYTEHIRRYYEALAEEP